MKNRMVLMEKMPQPPVDIPRRNQHRWKQQHQQHEIKHRITMMKRNHEKLMMMIRIVWKQRQVERKEEENEMEKPVQQERRRPVVQRW